MKEKGRRKKKTGTRISLLGKRERMLGLSRRWAAEEWQDLDYPADMTHSRRDVGAVSG